MSESLPRIGFIGIGTMGRPMAARIREAGYPLIVHDLDAEVAAGFARETGAAGARDLMELADSDILITMLPTGQIVREVLLDGGNGAFLDRLAPGTVVVDMSSSEPAGTRELGEALWARDIHLVDAPVSGAAPRARNGTLTIMIGADQPSAVEKAKPVLSTMGDRLFETGGLGTGHAVKALNNFVAATAYAATAEAVLAARRFGLDPNTLVDVLNVSTGHSFISEKVMKEHVLEEQYATGFQLGLLAKDVDIAARLCEGVHLDAPLVHLLSRRWALAAKLLGPRSDHTEAIKVWDEDMPVEY